jgi:hypothetical protein
MDFEKLDFNLDQYHQYEKLKQCFKNLQDETFDEEISNLVEQLKTFYGPFLDYFKYVHKENSKKWYTNDFDISHSDKSVGTDILLNNTLDGFEYFFGYDNDDGILLFASKFGILAGVGIRSDTEDIKSIIDNFIDEDNTIFVCVITFYMVDGEKYFTNNFDEKIFYNVGQRKGKAN